MVIQWDVDHVFDLDHQIDTNQFLSCDNLCRR